MQATAYRGYYFSEKKNMHLMRICVNHVSVFNLIQTATTSNQRFVGILLPTSQRDNHAQLARLAKLANMARQWG